MLRTSDWKLKLKKTGRICIANYARKKTGKGNTGHDLDILLLQTAKHDHADNDRNRHGKTGHDVPEIAMKEPAAVFRFDAFCEILADLRDGVAVSITDRG